MALAARTFRDSGFSGLYDASQRPNLPRFTSTIGVTGTGAADTVTVLPAASTPTLARWVLFRVEVAFLVNGAAGNVQIAITAINPGGDETSACAILSVEATTPRVFDSSHGLAEGRVPVNGNRDGIRADITATAALLAHVRFVYAFERAVLSGRTPAVFPTNPQTIP